MLIERRWFGETPEVLHLDPLAACLVAEHLNGVLAAGEVLLASRLELFVPITAADVYRLQTNLRGFIGGLSVLEMRAAMRTLQARRRAGELRRTDRRFRPIASLFIAGTTPLVDAVAEFGDAANVDFHAGDDIIAYLRHRGLIAADAASLLGLSELAVTEAYRLAGHIEIGSLMDLASGFLDAIELHYEFYGGREEADGGAAAAA